MADNTVYMTDTERKTLQKLLKIMCTLDVKESEHLLYYAQGYVNGTRMRDDVSKENLKKEDV